ncbi:MAG: M3 family metallopeptidase [Bryobacteraceae bacterium]|nr:M3 family metallopeptidase [Bryobacteraceae bacterium]
MGHLETGSPLLDLNFPLPFDRVRAEDVQPSIQRLIEQARAERERIAAARPQRSWADTLQALDHMTEPLDRAMAVVRHLESVATYPELRSAYNAVEPLASEFYSSIPLHEGLWRAIREFASCEEASALSGVRRRFLTKTIDSFRRHGADLDAEGKARLAAIEVELSTLTTRFSQNVLDATNAFELVLRAERQLAGLPPSAIAAARQSAAQKGLDGWRFTLQAPSYTALMTYLDDEAIRRDVWQAYNTRAACAPWENPPLILRILELRRQKAALVGYPHFADFALADRMAKSAARARAFLEQLRHRTQSHFEREDRELRAFRRSQDGKDEMHPWDLAYWAEKQRKALFDFDEEELRPYFPAPRVIEGMFEIARRLFGIQIRPYPGVPVWDPQVTCYEARDEDGALLGWFYADWHPRENKRGGAWMDAFITGVQCADRFEPHTGAICGNLTPPLDGRPALLTHREVETIFHEFGHLLHQLLSKVEVRSLAGTNVAWDFVELPSQLMENWCWQREALDLFARHYETGEPIPEELCQKMRRARTYRAATAQMRQLGFGLLDFALHVDYDPASAPDVLAFSREVLQPFTPAPLPSDYAMIAGFTHLFGDPVGYAAGYYSYKWAEVLDADVFREFQARGVFDPQTGRRLRESILSKGDSADPADLFRDFMGRDPDPEALMQRLGLA